MAEHTLSLAVNGREHQLVTRLVPFNSLTATPIPPADGALAPSIGIVAVVGLGYVGLPTALGLHSRVPRITGIDISAERLKTITDGEADLTEADRQRLRAALADGSLWLTTDSAALQDADAVIICVPTPVDENHVPDLRALRAACSTVVEHAQPHQTIILTSTSFVGTTHRLLVEPLRQRGLRPGIDVYVAFSPERIDPGNPDHLQRETPRVVGGVTAECASRAGQVIGYLTDSVYLVSSPEAAEMTKLYENVFRAVTLALANEFADVCGGLGLDPIEVTLSAGTKPYGFLGAFPGPGVGGHCIPCDPYYLLWQLADGGPETPIVTQAMRSIEQRPRRVVRRAAEVLSEAGRTLAGARVIVVGASYKAGVRDLRESPSLSIMAALVEQGARVGYFDPLVPDLRLPNAGRLTSEAAPRGRDWDLALIHTVHPTVDYRWVHDCPTVLDATYQLDDVPHRTVV